MMALKYKLAKLICRFLPPILAQSVRNFIISIEEGEKLHLDFKKKSFTGSYFIGNTSDFHAFKFSIHGYFDWRNVVITNEVLKYKKGGDVVEVGANIGTETLSFCDVAKKYKSQVFAFEPVSSNMEVVIKNKIENNLENLTTFTCLVSNRNGKSYFNLPKGNNSGSGFISHSKNIENTELNVVALDTILIDKNISLICIDVEGFEYQVLQGSENLVKKYKPVLILEVNTKYLEKRGQVKFKEFYNYIIDLGYSCYSIHKLGISKVDFDNFQIQANKNWVCIENENHTLVKRLNDRLVKFALSPFIHIN